MRAPQDLFNAHLDGESLSADEAAFLSKWALASPDNAQAIIELSALHSQIDTILSVPRLLDELAVSEDTAVQTMIGSALQSIELQSAIEVRASSDAKKDATNSKQGRWHFNPVLISACLLLIAVSTAGFQFLTSSGNENVRLASDGGSLASSDSEATIVLQPTVEPVLATVSESLDAKWNFSESPHRGTQIRRSQQLIVEEGILAVTTASGCDIVIEAPAMLTFEASEMIRLQSGKLTAKIGGIATGLTIHTPTAKIVDLGTEFGVQVDRFSATNVAVYDGLVELSSTTNRDTNGPEVMTIRAGRAGHVDRRGRIRWTVETNPNDREFIRIDEVIAIQKARMGSEEAKQQVCFYQLQRLPGIVGFQSFDVPSDADAYSIGCVEEPIRSDKSLSFSRNIVEGSLYSSGAIEVEGGVPVYLDLDTGNNSPFARAGLLNDRGHIGRSGTELWISWKTETLVPGEVNSNAGLSLMFGDERMMQEPLFAGVSNSKPQLAVIANVGSRAIRQDLENAPYTLAGNNGKHTWLARITFSERADKVAFWCDTPVQEVMEGTCPHAEIGNAYIMFDRLRLGVSRKMSNWRFDDICISTNAESLAKAIELLEENNSL